MAKKRQPATGSGQRALLNRRNADPLIQLCTKISKLQQAQPPLVYIGLSEKAAAAMLEAVLAIITATKGSPHITLEALRVMAGAAKVENVTISDCTFGASAAQAQPGAKGARRQSAAPRGGRQGRERRT